jgi:AAA family ATP:ADP antiporter
MIPREAFSAWAKKTETAALLWSFALLFCLLCSYYILRPVRDEMGIQSGVKNLQWLFTATFAVMLAAIPAFGYITGRWRRSSVLTALCVFFSVVFAFFFLLFVNAVRPIAVAAMFFVWISVFNFFLTSTFWSFMADIFTSEQARRLYGSIAAGGSTGAIAGPVLTGGLVKIIGVPGLLLISSAFLILAAFCIRRLNSWVEAYGSPERTQHDVALGGSIWDGVKLTFSSKYLLGIAGFVMLLSLLATFVYFDQVRIVGQTLPNPESRTQLFVKVDLAVNVLALLAQLLVTKRFMARFGVGGLLFAILALNIVGFGWLALVPALGALIIFQVLRRVSEFALIRPAREVLFTVVTREEKYKAKNFIDTVIYRGGDALTGWAVGGLQLLGIGVAILSAIAIPFAAVAAVLGWRLGQMQACQSSGPARLRHDSLVVTSLTPIRQEEG